MRSPGARAQRIDHWKNLQVSNAGCLHEAIATDWLIGFGKCRILSKPYTIPRYIQITESSLRTTAHSMGEYR